VKRPAFVRVPGIEENGLDGAEVRACRMGGICRRRGQRCPCQCLCLGVQPFGAGASSRHPRRENDSRSESDGGAQKSAAVHGTVGRLRSPALLVNLHTQTCGR
jgi:hypothetical protein